ncbi:GSCOCT00008360001.2-RA-CDS [Cotesia congregata]|uniref:Carboxylesterase clade L member 5 n=1 Tax=Cotesia congregata TaxID=51543 RepID=A0A8J2MZI3_COTCN|nr:GSCOCT00008360001.2-RA-CDS [Cotesia congregata]CAG5107605.1 carboxylesterase clade L member 5 [Cotesia congregata]
MLGRCQPATWTWPLEPMLRTLDLVHITTTTTRWLVVILVFTICGTHAGPRYASRIVETRSGQIRGILQELNGRLDPVEVFRGIPYAAPPIGNLRLRPPSPPIPWSGIKLADTFGPVCPQKPPNLSNYTIALTIMPGARYEPLKKIVSYLGNQSEDCLTLNLYIPGSGSRGIEAPYAVIVYIHGESFEWGSGKMYDGSVLASAGHVIVVTLNYRLGILGFLRTRVTPDANGSLNGNLALKDIVRGLQWVRDNIGAFGGDPTRVTLMGHDTGAALVNLVLLAPFSKGLLHRVILLSGSALSPWASVHDPNNLRRKVGEQLNCSMTSDDEDIADCLRGVPLHVLLNIDLPEIKFMPRIGPALPVDQSNPDPAMDMERASDAFIKVPLILGVTTAEAYLDFNDNEIQFGFEENQRNRILRTYIRNAYYYHLNEILSAVRNEYTDWDKPIIHPVNLMEYTMEALSDGHTVAPLMRVAFYHARRGANTYFYHFSYQSKDSKFPQRLGSVRGEDIPYIFGLPLISGGAFFPHNYSRQDQGVAEAILTFLTNFAKTGNPNLPHNIESVDYGTEREKARFRGLNWEQYETESQSYLTIALKPKTKSHYRGHKMAMWLNLIPQLHQPGDEDVSMRHHHFREHGDHFYSGTVRDEWHTPVPLFDPTRTSTLSTSCTTQSEDQITEDMSAILNNNNEDAELLQRLASRHYYSTTTALAITVGVGCILLVLNMLIFAGIYYQRDRDKKRASTLGCMANGQDSLPMTTRPSIKSIDNNNPTSVQEPPPSYTTLARNTNNSVQSQQQKLLQQHQQQQNEIDNNISLLLSSANQQINNDNDDNDNDNDNDDNNDSDINNEQVIKNTFINSSTTHNSNKDLIMPPKPPVRTTSSLSNSTGGVGGVSGGGTIKKRVQIQEITV